ncbi:MAG: cell division protein FtsQ/DivIB [Alphaproteobacteria bacterium]
MIKRTHAPKTPSSRPPLRRRRRQIVPVLRRAVRWSALIALAGLVYGGFALSQSPNRDALLAEAADRAMTATAALGMVVEDIEVEGRETTERAMIMAALAAGRGTPILAVDLWRAKAELEKLPWVRSAAIERRLPRTLHVRLIERRPLALWQHEGRQQLIDRQGEVIPGADLGRFARLPLVVGDGAAPRAAALIEMLGREPALAARVTAAIRVDNRRWNLRIDDSIEVLLPEDNPEAAWVHLAAFERRNNLLKRDVQRVDMRLPGRLVVRVNAPPAPAKEVAPAKPRAPGKNT